MTENLFSLFILTYVLMIAAEFLIYALDIANIRRRGKEVPKAMEGAMSHEDLLRANEYSKTRLKLEFLRYVAEKIMVLAFLVSGLFAWSAALFSGLNFFAAGMLFFGGVFIASKAAGVPFGYYEKFVLEQRFGFNTSTKATWLFDLAKEVIVEGVMSGVLLAGVLLLMNYLPNAWWLFGWLFALAVSIFTVFIYPTVIIPMFNRLTPINESLAGRISDMARRAGINIRKISQMDASKRTRRLNAYFTGWGSSKSIILFDTMIAANTEDEIVAVLGHEMGHWRRRHILKTLAMTQAVALIGFFAAFLLIKSPLLYIAFGLRGEPVFAGLFVLLIVYDIPAFVVSPVLKLVARRFESEADEFSVRLTGRKDIMTAALRRLAQKNLTNLNPHPLFVFFKYTHPPVLKRLKKIERMGDVSSPS